MALGDDLADLDQRRALGPDGRGPVALQGEESDTDRQGPAQKYDAGEKSTEEKGGVLKNFGRG